MAITGDLDSGDPIRIDGAVDGDVRGTFVTVTREATVKGSIYAEAVRIAGSVTGVVRAATVVLTRDARLTGSIVCDELTIEPGAEVVIHCRAGRTHEAEPCLLPPPEAIPDEQILPACPSTPSASRADDRPTPAQPASSARPGG